jgi:Zn-dependent protease
VKLLLLLLSGAKFGKILLTGGTMLISVAAYSLLFGWWYAAGFVALIFVHEMGHFIAARRRGLNVGAPTFIPFVGTLGALACYYLGRQLGNSLLLALSYAGFFLNLFNLIPLSPFDGGRVTAAISPKLWLIGAPILIGLFLYRPNPLLLIFAIVAAPQVMKAWRGPQTEAERAYYNVSLETRTTYSIFYIGLVVFLAVMCHDLHRELPAARF